MKMNYVAKLACLFVALIPILSVTLWASALATPPQHIRNWDFSTTAGTTLGQVTTTAKNVTLTQSGLTSQPGFLPAQSIQISYDAVAGAPNVFFTATIDTSVPATIGGTGNGTNVIRLVAGDPPISVDGRFNFFSVIRDTTGTNVDVNLRLKAVY